MQNEGRHTKRPQKITKKLLARIRLAFRERKMSIMKRMPALFVGHGSPMNAIENNRYTSRWQELGVTLARPKAILAVSAHWFVPGLRVNDDAHPRQIYDMYGFPEELYRLVYGAPGAPRYARLATEALKDGTVVDNSWGIDHGSWSVLCKMFPKADIPVFQLSVDRNASAQQQFETGRRLAGLREHGVMILGSGNVVHNLARVNWNMEGGYPWAEEFDGYIKQNVLSGRYENVLDYRSAGASAALAVPTPDHFAPLSYVLGAVGEQDLVSVFNDSCVLGSLSMTGYLFE